MHSGYLEYAPRKCAGLVEYHRPYFRQSLEVVGALDEHTLAAGSADAGEERQGNADNQGARAAYDKESERPVDPYIPHRASVHSSYKPDYRGNERKREGGKAYSWSIDAREP